MISKSKFLIILQWDDIGAMCRLVSVIVPIAGPYLCKPPQKFLCPVQRFRGIDLATPKSLLVKTMHFVVQFQLNCCGFYMLISLW